MAKSNHMDRKLTEEDFRRLKEGCISKGYKDIPNLEIIVKEACAGKTIKTPIAIALACLGMLEPWEAIGVVQSAEDMAYNRLRKEENEY